MEHIYTQSISVRILGVVHLLATGTNIFISLADSLIPLASTSSNLPGTFSLSLAVEYITGIYILARLCLDHPDGLGLLPHAIVGGCIGLNVALIAVHAGSGAEGTLAWLSPVFWVFLVLDVRFCLGFRAVEWLVKAIERVVTGGRDVAAHKNGVVRQPTERNLPERDGKGIYESMKDLEDGIKMT